MVGKTASLIPEDLTAEDWRGLLGAYPNALLIGPSNATGRVIEALLPQLQQPVCRCAGGGLTLPENSGGTLIVDDVAALSPDDQRRLLAWLLEPGRMTQVVATASCALFPRVTNGSFLDVLYYRLNVMAFTLGSNPGHSA
jgi:hypothetical protein